MQIAVRTRLKLIYRPKTLKGIPEEVTHKLKWRLTGSRLTVSNPTPFYMNFNEVTVGNHPINEATFVAPMSSATFATPGKVTGLVSWKTLATLAAWEKPHAVSLHPRCRRFALRRFAVS